MIRVATKDDINSIVTMWSLFDDHVITNSTRHKKEEEYEKLIQTFVEELIASENSVIYLAELEAKIVGFCSGHIEKMPWFKETIGLIGSCWVNESNRRKGIGSNLVHHVEVWLESKQPSVLEVIWDNMSEEAEGFWLGCGYKPKLTRACKIIGNKNEAT